MMGDSATLKAEGPKGMGGIGELRGLKKMNIEHRTSNIE
jgi:hypothetical protein